MLKNLVYKNRTKLFLPLKIFLAKIFLGQLFCLFLPLGVLFTNRAFEELVLGLSWRGNPELDGVGGICQSR